MDFVYKDNKVLNIIYDVDSKEIDVSSREVNPKISKNLNSIMSYQNSISINEKGLFDRPDGYIQAWKVKKNNLIPKIIHNQIETIIFSKNVFSQETLFFKRKIAIFEAPSHPKSMKKRHLEKIGIS